MAVEVRDVAEGLWLWRHAHPDWSAGSDWEPEVSSFAVESRGARVLLDPLAPPPSEREAWERIDAFAPDTAVVLKPDHVRDVDRGGHLPAPRGAGSPRSEGVRGWPLSPFGPRRPASTGHGQLTAPGSLLRPVTRRAHAAGAPRAARASLRGRAGLARPACAHARGLPGRAGARAVVDLDRRLVRSADARRRR